MTCMANNKQKVLSTICTFYKYVEILNTYFKLYFLLEYKNVDCILKLKQITNKLQNNTRMQYPDKYVCCYLLIAYYQWIVLGLICLKCWKFNLLSVVRETGIKTK